MVEKLTEIINEYEERIFRHETKVKNLEDKITFCTKHQFLEEVRIAQVEYISLQKVVYQWREMQESIREVLNAWNS